MDAIRDLFDEDRRKHGFYVSCIRDQPDGDQRVLARGAFHTHQEAVDAVSAARNEAMERFRDGQWLWFARWGTACVVVEDDQELPLGVLDQLERRAAA